VHSQLKQKRKHPSPRMAPSGGMACSSELAGWATWLQTSAQMARNRARRCQTPVSIHLINQPTTFLSLRLIRGVRRQLLGKHHTSSMTHLTIMISAVNNSFNSSLTCMCCPLGSGTVLSSSLHDLSSHMPMYCRIISFSRCVLLVSCAGVSESPISC